MIKDLLNPNFHRRPSADEVLNKYNLWFKKLNENVDFEIAVLPLANLKVFNPQKKLQLAVISFIVDKLTTTEERKDLKKAFNIINTNKNG